MVKTKAVISPNYENVWDLKMEEEMKKKSWEISRNSFLKRKGERKNQPFLAMANFVEIWETTWIIKKIISLVIWDPNGIQKIGNAQVWYSCCPYSGAQECPSTF